MLVSLRWPEFKYDGNCGEKNTRFSGTLSSHIKNEKTVVAWLLSIEFGVMLGPAAPTSQLNKENKRGGLRRFGVLCGHFQLGYRAGEQIRMTKFRSEKIRGRYFRKNLSKN